MAKAPQRDQYGTSKKTQGNQIIEEDSTDPPQNTAFCFTLNITDIPHWCFTKILHAFPDSRNKDKKKNILSSYSH